MKNLLLIFSFLLLNLSFAQTSQVLQYSHNGITRTYKIYVPAMYDGTSPVPLLFNLHGYGSDFEAQEIYGDFRSIADTANFILIHPNGTLDNTNNRFWNFTGLSTVDDQGFIFDLVDEISSNYNINQHKIYSVGMSNGGFMSYKMACDSNSPFAAVGSVTGSMLNIQIQSCNASQPTPIIQIHGTDDLVVPYNGNVSYASIQDVIDFWVGFNQANPNASPVNIDNNPNDLSDVDFYRFVDGLNGAEIELFKVNSGGHTWPGAIAVPGLGVTNQDINASKEIWRFFQKYSKDELLSSSSFTQDQHLKVFPNPAVAGDVIKLSADFSFSTNDIEVLDVLGKNVNVKSSQISNNECVLDFSSPGVYFLKINTVYGLLTKKIILN